MHDLKLICMLKVNSGFKQSEINFLFSNVRFATKSTALFHNTKVSLLWKRSSKANCCEQKTKSKFSN